VSSLKEVNSVDGSDCMYF